MNITRSLRTILLAAAVIAIPASSFAGIFLGISIGVAPPPLPIYAQPAIPAPGYMWTPGYWAWGGDGGYYWVPGTWVQPPSIGLLWTPGYWGWNNGAYAFSAGYWGPHIGFYGGVNYGYGYGGFGYEGGYWNHGVFAYNRSVNNISNTNITNVYNKTVINNTTVNNTSFNGGAGGIQARPTPAERAAVQENHVQPTAAQVQHVNQAQSNPQLRAAVNGGRPAIAATARPGDFNSAVPARAAGGQVNTAVYRAAASNGGKLPSGMSDPGSVSANRTTVSTPAERPAAEQRPEASAAMRAGPNATPVMPRQTTVETRPETEATRPQTQARPAAQSRPEYQQRPAAQSRSEYQAKPVAQSKPAPQPKPQAQHSQPKRESQSHEERHK